MTSSWFLVIHAIYIIIAIKSPLFIVLPIISVLFYFLRQKKIQSKYITKMELVNNDLLIHFMDRHDQPQLIQIPISDVTADFAHGGKSAPCLVIEEKWEPCIKQYATIGWNRDDIKETAEKLQELKKQALIKHQL